MQHACSLELLTVGYRLVAVVNLMLYFLSLNCLAPVVWFAEGANLV